MQWQFDEIAHAGPEHLDPAFVASFDEKMGSDWSAEIETLLALGIGQNSTVVDLGAGTGTFAQAIQEHVAQVIAVDVSEAMLAAIRARGIHGVRSGFLNYEHQGPPPDAVFTSNALHHLPDFWKAIALQRIGALLGPGGVLRLRDFVYTFPPGEADEALGAWLASSLAAGWQRAELAEHVLNEHSTFDWLLEPMIERAGFEIRERSVDPSQVFAAYTCVRH